MGACLEGYFDVDGDPSNGCEFFDDCEWISPDDEPDELFIDANCDGIDGEIGRAIFVDILSGSDSNSGLDMDHPKMTLEAGINAAAAVARDYVLVSRGQYVVETLNLASGVSIHGGYDAASEWSRDAANTTTISGGTRCVQGGNISNIKLSYLDIESADTSTPHSSSYGLTLTTSANVEISNCTIRSGQGGDGQGGSSGAGGVSGQSGRPGQSGCEDSSWPCSSCGRPAGGAGGASVSGKTGGGGPSVCILHTGTTLFATSNTYNTGTAGQGGLSNGNPGQYGVATSIYAP